MTIADQLTLLSSTKTAIKQAIEDKGITVGAVPFADYPTKIAAISGGSTPTTWVRPADWLPLPTVTETDQKFVGLHAVYPDANFVALSAAGDYTVDWGDGVVENFASSTVAQHEYNYDTYDVGGTTLCSRGYKQAVVTVTTQAGQSLTFLNLHQRHSALPVLYSSGFLDIALASASLTDLRIGVQAPGSSTKTIRFAGLERVNIVRSSVADFSYLFNGCYSLQAVVSILTHVVSNVNMSSMFQGCTSITSVPLFNTTAVTNMSGMFNSCTSITSVPLFNTTAVTSMSNMFYGCPSLSKVSMTGMKASFSVANCKLSAVRLNDIYSNLATVTGQTITVTGNYGTATDDPTIATAKGWTVTG